MWCETDTCSSAKIQILNTPLIWELSLCYTVQWRRAITLQTLDLSLKPQPPPPYPLLHCVIIYTKTRQMLEQKNKHSLLIHQKIMHICQRQYNTLLSLLQTNLSCTYRTKSLPCVCSLCQCWEVLKLKLLWPQTQRSLTSCPTLTSTENYQRKERESSIHERQRERENQRHTHTVL